MSYTVVIDEGERARQTENQINKAARHCKVRVKTWKQWTHRPFPITPYPKHVPDKWVYPQNPDLSPYPIQWWQNPVVSTC